MGDVDEVLRKAKEDFDKGEYQWVAEVTNTIVFADPTNQAARLLCADTQQQYVLQVKYGVFLVYENTQWENADATVTCPENALSYISAGQGDMFLQYAKVQGDITLLTTLADSMNQFAATGINGFNIIEP